MGKTVCTCISLFDAPEASSSRPRTHPDCGDHLLRRLAESASATHRRQTYFSDFSALRRHVGTDMLGFTLQVRKGKARYFAPHDDARVTAFLASCRFAFLPVNLGRFELEELLIRKYRPALNRKDNVAS